MRSELGWDIATLAAATVATLGIAAGTELGPVVADLTATHGVHAGDVVAGLVAFTAAATSMVGRRLAR